jgi:cell division protease FtsH
VNSTLKSLLFWMALVVVGVVIWNVSTKLQQNQTPLSFSEFMASVEAGNIEKVEITGQEIKGTNKSQESFHTYAPDQYEGLANKLIDRGVIVLAKGGDQPWASLLYMGADPLDDRLLDLLHASDAERG